MEEVHKGDDQNDQLHGRHFDKFSLKNGQKTIEYIVIDYLIRIKSIKWTKWTIKRVKRWNLCFVRSKMIKINKNLLNHY